VDLGKGNDFLEINGNCEGLLFVALLPIAFTAQLPLRATSFFRGIFIF
jgi:hypothetical protein